MNGTITILAVALAATCAVLAVLAWVRLRAVGSRRPAAGADDVPSLPNRAALVARVAELEAQLPAVVRQIREIEESNERRFRSLHGSLARERRGAAQEAANASTPTAPLADDGSPVLTPALAAQLGIDLEAAAPVAEQRAALGMPPLPPLARRRFGGR